MSEQKIKGYRKLEPWEVEAINTAKETEALIVTALEDMVEMGADKRALAPAKTNIQQGFMWLTRAIAKPES